MHASFVPFEESQWIRMTLVVVIGRSALVSRYVKKNLLLFFCLYDFFGLAYQGKDIVFRLIIEYT
jgi:hypothetical protein